jgi:uncharacterized membrane protein
MDSLIKFLHIAAAIVWLGGVGFMQFALRPAAMALLLPPARLPLMAAVMERFFVLVWCAIAILLLTGGQMLGQVGMKAAPLGWHLMFGIGVLMFLIFGHIYFSGFRRLKRAVAAADWPEAGKRVAQIANMAGLNFVLGWLAIAAVLFLK